MAIDPNAAPAWDPFRCFRCRGPVAARSDGITIELGCHGMWVVFSWEEFALSDVIRHPAPQRLWLFDDGLWAFGEESSQLVLAARAP